jgi:outer membrane protein assembly factor BamB
MPSHSRQVRRAQARRAEKRGGARSRQRRGGPGLPGKVPKIPRAAWLAAGALAVVAAIIVVVAAGSSGSSEKVSFTGSGYPNENLSNTRDVSGSIEGLNVAQLKVAWTLPIATKSQYGSYSSSPIVSEGVIYSQDLSSNVQAISLKTGKVLWTKSYESPDQGPNGLVVAGGHVFGATATSAFALDQKTGEQTWSVPLVRNESEGIDMAPGYHNGIVYVSTVPGNNAKFYAGGGVGILWALEAGTGKKLWHFDTVPESLWSPSNANINSGGGLWYSPAFDSEGNMYVGVANPAPFPGTEQYPWGSSRPGPNLYTDSIVKLDATTGKLLWYYQLTPHDLYDHDLQDPPILTTIKGKQAVIAAGKSGIVIALDSHTGKLIWKRPVGTHNGHDNDGLYAMRHEYSKLKMPETIYPGLLGGVISPMSTNGSTVFVPVVNLPVSYTSQTTDTEGPESSGELVALNTQTGTVEWDHKFSVVSFGSTTVSKNVVFATTSEGTVYGFDTTNGTVLWTTQLPAGTNTGVAVSGDTLIAPAGLAQQSGQTAELVAYRLPAGG